VADFHMKYSFTILGLTSELIGISSQLTGDISKARNLKAWVLQKQIQITRLSTIFIPIGWTHRYNWA